MVITWREVVLVPVFCACLVSVVIFLVYVARLAYKGIRERLALKRAYDDLTPGLDKVKWEWEDYEQGREVIWLNDIKCMSYYEDVIVIELSPARMKWITTIRKAGPW